MSDGVVLVAGAAGFIGTNLCLKLLNDGKCVVGVDNLCTGQERNLNILSTFEKFHFFNIDISGLNHDICSLIDTLKAYKKIESIYYLASPASPPKYKTLPLETIFVNTVGLNAFLKLAEDIGTPLLFASTSEIYGDPLEHPQKEEYYGNTNSFGERSCYDESKRLGETICRVYLDRGVDVKVARIFNTYGPYMDINDGRVVTNFIKAGIMNDAYSIFGDGQQTRSFCYIDDMVEGLEKLMMSSCDTPINLGNPDELTVLDLAKLINSFFPSFVFRYINMPAADSDDPKKRNPDIGKAEKLLGWKPKVKLEDGLNRTIAYFAKRERL